jgi:uncharacterized membrane protein YtjA (UPF0391 family)
MLQASIGFFVVGLLAMIFGIYNVAGISLGVGRLLLGVFVFLAVVTYVISLTIQKPSKLKGEYYE